MLQSIESNETMTIRSLWEKSAASFSTLPALSYVDRKPYTYFEVDSLRVDLQAKIYHTGIRTGGKIALFSENMPHWGVVYLAIVTGGWTVVPVLPDFTGEEVANIITHSDTEVLFVSKKLYEKIKDLPELEGLTLFYTDSLEAVAIEGKKDDGAKSIESVSPTLPEIESQDLAAIIYTSGTTGMSKGVMLSHGNIASNAMVGADIPEKREAGQRMLSVLPLSHAYECTLGFLLPLVNGFCVYYLDRPPSPTVLLPALAKVRPHLMLSVPLLIEKVYRSSVLKKFQKSPLLRTLYRFSPTRKLLNILAGKKLLKTFGGELYFFGIGGAKIAEDVEKFLQEARFPYAVGYGLTETSPLIAGTNAVHQSFRSTGPSIDRTRVRIEKMNETATEGEIQVKGPGVMLGYYRDEQKTAESFTADGWFRTGDTGVLDESGNLYIEGRIKTMILGPSGENIYPEAIEAMINEFDYVEDSLVVQHKNSLIARVRLNDFIKNAADVSKDISHDVGQYLRNLQKMVNKRLATFSRISTVLEETKPFIKTPTMKIKRYLYEGIDPVPDQG